MCLLDFLDNGQMDRVIVIRGKGGLQGQSGREKEREERRVAATVTKRDLVKIVLRGWLARFGGRGSHYQLSPSLTAITSAFSDAPSICVAASSSARLLLSSSHYSRLPHHLPSLHPLLLCHLGTTRAEPFSSPLSLVLPLSSPFPPFHGFRSAQ